MSQLTGYIGIALIVFWLGLLSLVLVLGGGFEGLALGFLSRTWCWSLIAHYKLSMSFIAVVREAVCDSRFALQRWPDVGSEFFGQSEAARQIRAFVTFKIQAQAQRFAHDPSLYRAMLKYRAMRKHCGRCKMLRRHLQISENPTKIRWKSPKTVELM